MFRRREGGVFLVFPTCCKFANKNFSPLNLFKFNNNDVPAQSYNKNTTLICSNHRSSRPEVFCKKVILEILQNVQESTGARASFLIKLQVSGTGVFLWILWISKNTFFTEDLWTAASEKLKLIVYSVSCKKVYLTLKVNIQHFVPTKIIKYIQI